MASHHDSASLGLLGGILLAVWNIPFGLKYFAWYMTFAPVVRT